MSVVTVRHAESEADFAAARVLCHAWVDWQLKVFPEQRSRILSVFAPEAYGRTLADLPRIRARPKGSILLADLDDRPVGCVMYLEMAPASPR